MLNAVKTTFSNLQSQTVMNQNVTNLTGLNQVLNQEIQQKSLVQAQISSSKTQLTNANNNLNIIKSLTAQLKTSEKALGDLLTQNQTQGQKLDSYLTDFVNNEFEDLNLLGDSINPNQN